MRIQRFFLHSSSCLFCGLTSSFSYGTAGKDPNWLQNVNRQTVRLYLLSYADKELTNSLVLASDWLSKFSVCDLKKMSDNFSHFKHTLAKW